MPDRPAATVLLVSRDQTAGRGVIGHLSDRGYDIEWVDDDEKAFNRLDTRPFDVVVSDLGGTRIDGLRLMGVSRERNPEICIVFLVDQNEVERATEAMQQGAYDFQIRPVNLGRLEAVIRRGLDYQHLILEQHELKRRLDEHYGLGSLIGNSRPMIRLYDAVRQAVRLESPVLIQGESGTGKDLIAQAIHSNGSRRDEVFAKVRCSGVPKGRLDCELFGYAAGAFPGADRSVPGRIENADRGTLFLDEVGDLSTEQQAAFVKVLTSGRVFRIKDSRAIRVDVRLIASTSRALSGSKFRDDLLSKLVATVIEVPPLRARREDIPLLVQHFLQDACREAGFPNPGITSKALDLLMRYDWPGNVRELKNVADGMALIAQPGRPLDAGDVPAYIRREATSVAGEVRIPVGTSMDEAERLLIEETMKACGHNKEECARTLGIGLRTLYRKLNAYENG